MKIRTKIVASVFAALAISGFGASVASASTTSLAGNPGMTHDKVDMTHDNPGMTHDKVTNSPRMTHDKVYDLAA